MVLFFYPNANFYPTLIEQNQNIIFKEDIIMRMEFTGVSFKTFTDIVKEEDKDLKSNLIRIHYEGNDKRGTVTISGNNSSRQCDLRMAEICQEVGDIIRHNAMEEFKKEVEEEQEVDKLEFGY